MKTTLSILMSICFAVAGALAQTSPFCPGYTNTMLSQVNGYAGDGDSSEQWMNQDGRRIIFNTYATGLVNVPAEQRPNGRDVLLWDRDRNALTSIGARAPAINNGFDYPRISRDGNFVAFWSNATNIDGADNNNNPDLYAKDLTSGRWERISLPDDAILKNEEIREPGDGIAGFSIDGTGRYYAFLSASRSLSYEYFTGQDSFGGDEQHVYVRDRVARRTWLVSKGKLKEDGTHEALNGLRSWPMISADGQTVYFITNATNLQNFERTEARYDIYRATYDPGADEWHVVQRIPTPAGIENTHARYMVSLSPNARFFAYVGWHPSGGGQEIYVYDAATGQTIEPRGSIPYVPRDPSYPYVTDHGIAWYDSIDYTGHGGSGGFYLDLLDPGARPIRIGITRNGTGTYEVGRPNASDDGMWFTFWSRNAFLLPGQDSDGNNRNDVFLQHSGIPATDCPRLALDVLNGIGLANAAGTDVLDTPAGINARLQQDPTALLNMRGITADGAARVVLRAVTAAPGTVRFTATYRGGVSCDAATPRLRALGGGPEAAQLDVANVAQGDGTYVAYAVLLAPEDFARGGAACSDRTVRTRWIDIGASQDVSGNVRIGTRALELYRPTVLLIHGIWSKSTNWDWDAVENWLVDIVRVDYRATDGEEFARNVPIVAEEATLAIENRNLRQIATARVDVFAHSMGAVLTRHWAAASPFATVPANRAYRRAANYQLGSINRLVPVNSPQFGSELADVLFRAVTPHTVRAELVQKLFASVGKCLNCGAVEDLRTQAAGGTRTVWAQPTDVFAHAMTGQATPAQFVEASKALAFVTRVLDLIGINDINQAFGGCANDGIVAVYSQTAALNSTTAFSGVGAVHTEVMSDPDHADAALDLLNGARATFFQPQLPVGPPAQIPCLAANPNVTGNAPNGGILITADAVGIVTPGQVITVTLQPFGDYFPIRGFVATTLGDVEQLFGAPLHATITVPFDAAGEFEIIGAAADPGNRIVASPPLRFFIDAPGTLHTLAIGDGAEIGIDGVNASRPLAIRASFGNGAEVDVRNGAYFDNGSAVQLTFTSSNPSVVTVSAKGVLLAQQPGTAIVEVSSGTVRATALVRVLGTSTAACSDGIDNDGDGTIDFGGDAGCSSALDLTEIGGATACDDGIDNDLDGLVDRADAQCTSSAGVFENAAPVASFSISCNSLTCTFDARLSTASRAIASYAWTFGDGSTGTGSLVTHAYTTAGVRPVTLTVTDVDGQNDSEQGNAIADAAVPVARYTFVCNGLQCSFDASTSTDDTSIVSYIWDFGDSSTGSGASVVHTFTAGTRTVKLTVTDLVGRTDDEAKVVSTSDAIPTLPMQYVAVTPCRVFDTRLPPGTPAVAYQPFSVNMQGSACGTYPNARAVSINVAVVTPTATGHLRLYPTGQASNTSVLNFQTATSPRANNAIIPLAADGTLIVYPYLTTTGATVHVIIDINGYFTEQPAAGVTGLGFQTLTPCRAYDSRLTAAPDGTIRPFNNGEIRDVKIQGNCGVPVGVPAASYNLVAVVPNAQGYLRTWAAGTPSPVVSTLNFVNSAPYGAVSNGARTTVASLSGRTTDLSVLAVLGGTTHVVVDTNGYFKSDAPLRYHPVTPCRAVDTRWTEQGPAMAHNESRAYQIRGNCGVPATAKAAMLNLTAFSPTNFGYLTIWPAGITKPVASTLTFVPGSTTANGTFVPLSQTEANDLGVYAYQPSATLHVIIDVFGYFD